MSHAESREMYERVARRARPADHAGVGAFMGTVYAWMTVGLGLSAFVAYQCSQNASFMESMMIGDSLFWAVISAPFILIFIQAFRRDKASMGENAFWYLLTTGIMGTWLSSVALRATEDAAFATTVGEALSVSVAMFAGMSATGWVTKKDLTGLGNFLIAGLWGLIAVGFLNFFLFQSASVNLVYHIAGVVIFAGLVAYDTQQIKGYYYKHGAHHGLAIWGALTLYLDFINIFLHLLRLMGISSSND